MFSAVIFSVFICFTLIHITVQKQFKWYENDSIPTGLLNDLYDERYERYQK